LHRIAFIRHKLTHNIHKSNRTPQGKTTSKVWTWTWIQMYILNLKT